LEVLPPGVWRFKALLPEVSDENIVTLGEGGTPLLQADRLGDKLGFENLLIKDETRNPTGSFMDRGSTVLVSLAREKGVRKFTCVTTGNLGASLAAYSAKAGIEANINIHPRTDHGKLYQMIAYGAKVEILTNQLEGDRVEPDAFPVSAGNPLILAGELTTGFEIVHDLGWKQPDAIILPVWTGGHLTMVWRAIRQLTEAGLVRRSNCKLIGVQLKALSSARAPQGKKRSLTEEQLTELEESEPIFREAAMKSIEESNGQPVEVSAREAIAGTGLLARTEGIYAEPAAASVVASLEVAKERGILKRDDRIVCVITGTGLKDTRTIRKTASMPGRLGKGEEFLIRPLQFGATKLELMLELSRGPAFGYDLWKKLSQLKPITTASVYQHLSELESAGAVRRSRVVTVRGRERIFYELTKRGAGLLRAIEGAR
jgi:threonine synthase